MYICTSGVAAIVVLRRRERVRIGQIKIDNISLMAARIQLIGVDHKHIGCSCVSAVCGFVCARCAEIVYAFNLCFFCVVAVVVVCIAKQSI